MPNLSSDSPDMSNRRYERPIPRFEVFLQERDRGFVRLKYQIGLASATCDFLLWNAASTRDSTGYERRIKQLCDAGYIVRFSVGHNPTLSGRLQPDFLSLGWGSAGVVIDAGLPLSEIPADRRAILARAVEEDGKRVVDLLDTPDAEKRLKRMSEQVKNIITGSHSATHTGLIAALTSMVVYTAARSDGRLVVHAILPENDVVLSATVPTWNPDTKKFEGDLLTRKPDSVLVVEQPSASGSKVVAYCVEAETGSSARHKLHRKVSEYKRLRDFFCAKPEGKDAWRTFVSNRTGGRPVDSLRVVFYCATQAHVTTLHSVIAEVFGDATDTGMFLTLLKADATVEHPAAAIYSNGVLANGQRAFDYFRTVLTTPVCTVVRGGSAHRQPLFDLPPAAERAD